MIGIGIDYMLACVVVVVTVYSWYDGVGMKVNGTLEVVELEEEDVESCRNVGRLYTDCCVWVK